MSLFKRSKPIDAIYVEGPGDIVESLTRWHQQEDFISETSRTFSGQVFDFFKKQGFNSLAISHFPQKKHVAFEQFAAFSQPKMMLNGALGYHFSQILYGFYLLGVALKYRPTYLHITNGVTHWFMLAPLKLLGIKIFPQFHNTFWAKGFPPSGNIKLFLLKLDAWFLSHIADAAICCSPEIKRQIEEMTHGNNCPTFVFKAQFYRENFENPLPPPAHHAKPFVVIFAGRIEHNKGVFDILSMGQQLKNEQVVFHICGGGSDLEALKNTCTQLGLDAQIHIHGRLNRPELLAIYSQGHAVIVPTRSGFCEGLPLVAIEGILLGRPVITSALSNALDVLGDAIVEAQAEHVESYVAAIHALSSNAALYQQKQTACLALREQFLDGKHGLANVLENTLN
jgi:glycogen synthase